MVMTALNGNPVLGNSDLFVNATGHTARPIEGKRANVNGNQQELFAPIEQQCFGKNIVQYTIGVMSGIVIPPKHGRPTGRDWCFGDTNFEGSVLGPIETGAQQRGGSAENCCPTGDLM